MASRKKTYNQGARRGVRSGSSRISARFCERCSKVSFRSELDAKIALMRREAGEKGEKRAYPCPGHNGWHLTSQEKWKPKDRAETHHSKKKFS